MKTFTFYEDRENIYIDRCSYSIQANSIEEAEEIMLNAIKNSDEDRYSNFDWQTVDSNQKDIVVAFYDENNNQIWGKK